VGRISRNESRRSSGSHLSEARSSARATDAIGTWAATYNNQGLLATIRNPAAQLHLSVTYNIDDRAISVAYARNVVTTRTFDYLGRVRTHTGPRGLAVTTYTVQAVGSGEQRTFSLR
jgi:hypothetical protein